MSSSASHRRVTNAVRARRLATLLPLGVVSASWTLAVAGTGLSPVPAVSGPVAAPPSVSAPEVAVDLPAVADVETSIARPVRLASAPARSTTLIPAAALAAYQRAETIIDGADSACRLSWPLLAAIGKVESNHGGAGASTLDDQGVAVPAIIGVALDGTRSTAEIPDTDGGRMDRDLRWDRAVGPMQFIPSTWAVVGVDADDDGERNPQDVDDAALAAAVYLCSGEEDLGTSAGRRAAVLRYNRSASYADMVLRTAASYAAGALTASAGVVVPAGPTALPAKGVVRQPKGGSVKAAQHSPAPRGPRSPAAPAPAKDPGPADQPATPAPAPPSPRPPSTPAAPAGVVTTLLTTTEAILACTLTGLNQLLQPGRFRDCVKERTS